MKEERSLGTVVTLLALIVVALLAAWWLKPRALTVGVTPPPPPPPVPAVAYRLSPLGNAPDWKSLEAYQSTITREQFESDLTQYFTCSNAWQEWIEFRDGHALIIEVAGDRERKFRLDFAPTSEVVKAPRFWRTKGEMAIAAGEQPLKGVHIAIDAGHLGGQWAQMEERWFKIGDGRPVTEGDMTLYVAKLLESMLLQKGATVSMVRSDTQPLTSDRPAQLLPLVREQNPTLSNPFYVNKAAESLFYRTSEIRARAAFVNQAIKPDLVLCLHFNAVGWGDPANPTLVDENHFHILLNGAFTDEEIGYDDQRYEMIRKIVQGTIHEEAAVGAVMADVFAKQSGLPPYPYEPDSRRARNVAGHPYLWARNLLANRLYDCPVIFFEPYVMNSTEVYERIQAGDYQGMMVVAGKPRKSIFREYADAVVDGLMEYYHTKP